MSSEGGRRPGSWPVLIALGLGFLALFAWQRSRSPFLAISSESAVARALAGSTGVAVAEVMSLWHLLGVGIDRESLEPVLSRFAARRAAVGEDLAVLEAAGHGAAVDRALVDAGGDGPRAWLALANTPEAVLPVRFRAVRNRFGEALKGR